MTLGLFRQSLVVCFVLPGAVAASAAIIPTADAEYGTAVGTLIAPPPSNVSPGWEETDLHVSSWTVTSSDSGLPAFLDAIDGVWTGVGSQRASWAKHVAGVSFSTAVSRAVFMGPADGRIGARGDLCWTESEVNDLSRRLFQDG
jgi:hypothetical protein